MDFSASGFHFTKCYVFLFLVSAGAVVAQLASVRLSEREVSSSILSDLTSVSTFL